MHNIQIHAAPLQGITDYAWRNAHNFVFGKIMHYHTPFMRIERGEIRKRDINDIAPGNNSSPIIPQVLACKAQEMIMMISQLKELGYRLVEINLGCPHVPIMKKHKGCGLMAHPDELEEAISEISKIDDMEYAVKMRLGVDSLEQWRSVMPSFGILQPKFITMHPRIGVQHYKGELHMSEFEDFLANSDYPVIYNGDIKSVVDIDYIVGKYPTLQGIMIGRGLVADPALLMPYTNKVAYRRFHDHILDAAKNRFSGGDHQVLSHMKALWELYLPNAPHKERKRIIKSRNLEQYIAACNELFASIEESTGA